MVVLSIYVLMNEYNKPLYEVSALLKNIHNKYEKNICIKLNLDFKSFMTKVQTLGIGTLAVEVWERILTINVYDLICSSVASELKVSQGSVLSSRVMVNSVVKTMANKLAEITHFENSDLSLILQTKAKEAARQHSQELIADIKGKGSFSRMISRGEVNRVWTSGYEEDIEGKKHEKTRKELENVRGPEFQKILYDIYNVTPLMKFQTSDESVKHYTLFACFLNVYSKIKIEELNQQFNPALVFDLDNTSSSESVRKYRKYDLLMQEILPYIIDPVLNEDVYGLARTVCKFLFFQSNSQVTFFSRKVPLSGADERVWDGNFGLEQKFKRTKDAENFTTFLIGLLALIKLHNVLKYAHLTPFVIDPDVFLFEDPSTKFNSLEELVKYNRVYCQMKKLYFPDYRFGYVVNTQVLEKGVNFLALSRKSIDHITCVNRLIKVVEGDLGTIFVESAFEVYSLDLRDILIALSRGLHPALVLAETYDEDAELSLETATEWMEDVNDLLSISIKSPACRQYSVAELCNEVREVSDSLALIIEDFFELEMSDCDLINSVFNVLDILDCALEEIESLVKAPSGSFVSQFEIALSCSETEVFKALKAIRFNTPEEKSLVILNNLIKIFGDKVEMSKVNEYAYERLLTDEFQSLPVVNLIVSITNALDELYELVNSSGETFNNLLPNTYVPPITGQMLLEIRESVDGLKDQARFSAFIEYNKYFSDQDGYYKRADGSYVTKTINNKLGYLHNLGFYVFSDGTVVKWGA